MIKRVSSGRTVWRPGSAVFAAGCLGSDGFSDGRCALACSAALSFSAAAFSFALLCSSRAGLAASSFFSSFFACAATAAFAFGLAESSTAVYWRDWPLTLIWKTITGSLMAAAELRLTTASLPDLRTLAFRRPSEKAGLVPLSSSLASLPVTVTVPENGSPKPELTRSPPSAAGAPDDANSDTDNAISLILLFAFKTHPSFRLRRDGGRVAFTAAYHSFDCTFLPNLTR